MPLERYLAELSDSNKRLALSKLANLSALSPEELDQFREVWATMDAVRQRQIITRLVELAEQNPILDFDDIFISCLSDHDSMVRTKAIDGLWECDKRSLIDRFVNMVKTDSDESVRATAATALGRFVMLAELGKLRSGDVEKVRNALFEIIDSCTGVTDVARRAVEAISPLTLPQVRALIERAYGSDDGKMRVSAVFAMGRNSDPVWLPVLLKELANSDPEMRYEAAVACGELGSEEAVPYLRSLVGDLDSQVRLSAVAALGKIGGIEAEETLRRCLGAADEHVCEAAAEALEELSFTKEPLSFGIQ